MERAYRIIGVLEHTAQTIQKRVIPRLRQARESWKRRILWLDGIVFSALAVGAVTLGITGGYWQGLGLRQLLVALRVGLDQAQHAFLSVEVVD